MRRRSGLANALAWLTVAGVLALCLPRAAAQSSGPGAGPPIVVGSKKFPESRLLAQMLVVLLRDRGFPVTTRSDLGGTMIAFKALRSGAIDVYPEYTGTGLLEILKAPPQNGPQATLAYVREHFKRPPGMVWLDPFGFNNTYGLAMRASDARRRHIQTLSDLAAQSGQLVFGASHEFLNRRDGYPGLSAAYGLQFGDVRGLEHGLAYQALLQKKVDVIDVYTTDGKLDPKRMVVLQDDRGFFPPYQACPLVRRDALERHPGLEAVLNQLAGRIDEATMRQLNREVEVKLRGYDAVAVDFLRSVGLTRDAAPPDDSRAGMSLWDVMVRERAHLAQLTLQHLYLTGMAMGLAILVGVPLGIAVTRWLPAAGPVLTSAGILQTVPSLALLAFMIPTLGLGARPAIAALFLYALLPIVRNTFTGIRAVDPALVEVGAGMGLKAAQILTLVELPLAAPMIMAGIRTAAVISIGTATLAALIGAGGLGDPIITGLSLNDVQMVLTGAIPAALLAVVVDGILNVVERLVTPRGVQR